MHGKTDCEHRWRFALKIDYHTMIQQDIHTQSLNEHLFFFSNTHAAAYIH
jgi:hypothetical protein